MGNLVLPKPEQKHWVSYIQQRIKKNKNFLGFVSGPTGSGKSFSCLRICEEIDEEFDIDRCVFTGLELMDLINSGKLRKGSAILFEESGVEMSNRSWQSVTNKMLNYLMQTFRHKNFVLLMNSPYMDFIDSSMRKLFHCEMQTLAIDFKRKEVKLKPQLLQYSSRGEKFYYKRLRLITEEGVRPISIWNVPKPSSKLLIDYEKKKTEFTTRLNKWIYEELMEAQNKGKKKKELTDIQKGIIDMLKEGKLIREIARLKHRTEEVIRSSLRLTRAKGYEVKPIREGSRVVRYEVREPEA